MVWIAYFRKPVDCIWAIRTLASCLVGAALVVVAGCASTGLFAAGGLPSSAPSYTPNDQRVRSESEPELPEALAFLPAGSPVTFLNGPVGSPGHHVVVNVRAASDATCRGSITYVTGQPKNLGAKTTDHAGYASWTFTVNPKASRGRVPLSISCGQMSATTYLNVEAAARTAP